MDTTQMCDVCVIQILLNFKEEEKDGDPAAVTPQEARATHPWMKP